jgi:hypothetical protein
MQVAIIDAARHREHRQSRSPVLEGVSPYDALIDTGASSTMITSKVVRDLKLEPVGKLQFHGLDGRTWKPCYLFHVAFYDTSDNDTMRLDDGDQHVFELANPISRIHVCTRAIQGGELPTLPSFDVLLGMDVLATGELWFRKSGDFRFTF